MEQFNTLLDRYLNGQISDSERSQLMRLITNGQYDEQIKRRIQEILLSAQDEDMDTGRAKQILDTILATDKTENEKVISLPSSRRYWPWVAAAVLLGMLSIIGWNIFYQSIKPPIVIKYDLAEPFVFEGKQLVRLPDSSTVLLNDGGKLEYAASFGEKTREVTLVGEAYFDVRHNAGKPFKVHTGKVTTTVLGTAFNIKAWPQQNQVNVTVTRGKVEVGDQRRTYGVITPNQQMAVNTITYNYVQTNIEAKTVLAWKSKYLILEDVSMEDAVKILEAKYGVHISFSNASVGKCRVSGTFLNGEEIEQVLTVLTTVIQAEYTRQGSHISINGNGCE